MSRSRREVGRIPADITRSERMRRRLATKTGKRRYQKWQPSRGPVIGATRATRGVQQFGHRGLPKNHHLWRFHLSVHKLKKIFTRWLPAIAPAAAPGTRRRATDRVATAGASLE